MILYKKEPKPLIYLSGGHTSSTEKEEKAWIKRTGCKFRCYSFAYTCPGAFYYNKRMHQSMDISRSVGVGIMMDSGAASFHKFMQSRGGGQVSASKKDNKLAMDPKTIEDLKEKTIDQYVEYCLKFQKQWDFFVTFDFIKDCPTIRKVTKRLWKAGLTEACPVYHGDQTIDWFRRYCEDGVKIIGIGCDYSIKSRSTWRGKRYYYDEIFNVAEKYGTKLHGLAVTSLSLMFEYPWYSVDSSTWVKTAAYGKIIYVDPQMSILPQIHVSRQHSSHNPSYNNLPKNLQQKIRDRVGSYGYDFDKLRDDQYERSGFNAMIFSQHLHELKDQIAAKKVNWESLV